MASLDRQVSKVLGEMTSARNEADGRLVNRLNTTVDQLSTELNRAIVPRDLEGSAELETILSQELPRLKEEIIGETTLRKDLECKILS